MRIVLTMRLAVIAVLVTFVSIGYSVEENYGSVTVDKIVSVYDGDTFTVDINKYPSIIGKKMHIRIYGIDTPEMKDDNPVVKQKAKSAKDFATKKLTKAKVVVLKNLMRDKYFRVLATVTADGEDVGQSLINAGYAKPYFGATKEVWN